MPRSPSPEICDGQDNDCNGMIDEGLGTVSCGVGACVRSVASCVGGMPVACTPGNPVAEICDGIDNNCNGTIDDGRFTEQSPIAPNTPYSASKAGGEMQVRAHWKTFGTPAIITRCGNNFGPFQYPEKLIPFFISRLIDNKKAPLYGSGLQVRDWVYVTDHCSAIDFILHNGAPGEVYNIGTDCEMPNIEVARRLLALLGKPESLIKAIGDPRGGAHDRRYSVDAAKLRALGWKPRCAFEDSLESTVRWYVDHQDWWREITATTDYKAFIERFYGHYLGEDL